MTSAGAGERKQRQKRERAGRVAEHMAAALLMLKGYRILARRVKSRLGEIDLVAVRGRRLAFVEVKARATLADAQAAIAPWQARRLAIAAEHWMARNAAYRNLEIGLDAVLIVRGRLPRHVKDALQPR